MKVAPEVSDRMRRRWRMAQRSGSYNASRRCGRVAQWITRLTTDQEIPGSNPGVLAITCCDDLLHTPSTPILCSNCAVFRVIT